MHLWNDYEGKTLAGRWTLGRLLRTEGRSALFATEREGRPAVMRVTEALNDQAVLRARFAAIQAAGDIYLVAIQEFGDAEMDGTPLSYAVLEPTQESLAEILASRRLSPEETQEVATQVAGGLRALHAQGLVHGLVEPQSVLAAGEVIKLRSDCARPAPAPEDADLEGVVTPHADAVGLAGIIYRSLTQNRLQDAADALRLPEPYATIVRNTLRNNWGVEEISAELARPGRTAPAEAAPSPKPGTASTASFYATPTAEPTLGRSVATEDAGADSGWQQPARVPAERRLLIFGIAGAVVLVILLFALFHHHAPKKTVAATAAAPAVQSAPAAATAPAKAPAAAPVQATAQPEQPAAKLGGPVWRVVAFTYNHRSQAESKAAWVNRHFHGFHAAVWSRTGGTPFLVTLDGTMNQKQAFGLRDHARSVGVARDVYAQDYSR